MSEWINADDRLPDRHVPVLAKVEWQDEIILAWRTSDGLGSNCWDEYQQYHVCNGDATCDFSLEHYLVTHWMPLPDAPEEN